MILDTVTPILAACIDDDAPEDALFQARDIFEMILVAGEKASHLPVVRIKTRDEIEFVQALLKENEIRDEISFRTLIGCADLLLNCENNTYFFQVKRLFQILLNSLSR